MNVNVTLSDGCLDSNCLLGSNEDNVNLAFMAAPKCPKNNVTHTNQCYTVMYVSFQNVCKGFSKLVNSLIK